MRPATRILLGALLAGSAAGVLADAPGPAAAPVLLAVLLQGLPGLLPHPSAAVRGALAALFLLPSLLAPARGPWLLLLLPATLRALRHPRPERALRTAREATILAVGTLAFLGSPVSLAGAAASTLLLAALLPRLQAERIARLGGRAAPAPTGAGWAVPAVAASAALLFLLLPLALPGGLASGEAGAAAPGGRRPGREEAPGGGGGPGPGGSEGVTAARRVSIGDIGRLQRDLRPLLEITVLRGGRPAPAEDLGPLFRSGALEDFDGTTWESRGGRSIRLRARSEGLLLLPRRRLPRGEIVEQRLRFLAGGSDALFCLGMPIALGGEGSRAGILLVPRGEVRTAEACEEGATFVLRSVAVPGDLPAVDEEDLSPERRERLTALPPGHERAAALARGELGAPAGPPGRALLARVETFLARRCRYSLDIAPPRDAVPVEAFLFDSRRGHCELFASAAAVMLRAVGVPARVVVGFRGGLLEPSTGRYTLRGADAHAWTEAWIEEAGWVALDPTPGSGPERPEGAVAGEGDAAGPGPAAGLLDRILSFDAAARRRLAEAAGEAVASLLRTTFLAPDGSFRGIVAGVLALAAGLLGAGLLLRSRRAAPAPAPPRPPAPPPPVPEAWALLLERLAAAGLRRAPSETGWEFARRAVAAGAGPPGAVERLAASWAGERFGGLSPSAPERSELRALAAAVSVP